MKGMRIPTQTEDIYYINEKGRTGKTVSMISVQDVRRN